MAQKLLTAAHKAKYKLEKSQGPHNVGIYLPMKNYQFSGK
jgi:hypothetical protein